MKRFSIIFAVLAVLLIAGSAEARGRCGGRFFHRHHRDGCGRFFHRHHQDGCGQGCNTQGCNTQGCNTQQRVGTNIQQSHTYTIQGYTAEGHPIYQPQQGEAIQPQQGEIKRTDPIRLPSPRPDED